MFDDTNALFTATEETASQAATTVPDMNMSLAEYQALKDQWTVKIQAAAPSYLRGYLSNGNI